jgi:hypothetical protein
VSADGNCSMSPGSCTTSRVKSCMVRHRSQLHCCPRYPLSVYIRGTMGGIVTCPVTPSIPHYNKLHNT